MAWPENAYRNNVHKLKGRLLKIYLQLHGCKAGKGLKCKRWPVFRTTPKGNITIGNHVTIGYGITFEVRPSGRLIIGSHVNLTHNIILSSSSEVRLGNWCGVSENVSIRDNTHLTKKGKPYLLQGALSQPVTIGEDVWLGAGCVVLMGANIASGCVIGANSVITGSVQTEENGIYSGNPLQLAGKRK